jgi:predicted carbohydrate-binding protein with CBM5 and CBM33 domain
MSSRRRWIGIGTGLALVVSAGGAWLAQSAEAHGANASPGSRTYLCFQDAHWTGGDLDARNPACKQAIAEGGKQPLWDWPGVGNSATKGRTRGFIPDGKICSANNKTYAAYDAARADWPATHLTSGAKWDFRFPSHDGHPGTFYLYITKDGYDPTKPLKWDDLEDKPFDTQTFQQPNASGSDGREFDWNITLPANKSGRHLLLTFWQRSDADGAFFSCSDVVFDGGHGEISGYPNANEWKGTEPTPTTTSSPTATATATATATPTSTSSPTTTTPPTTSSAPPDPRTSTSAPTTPPSTTCKAQVNQVLWPTAHLTTLTLLNGKSPADNWKVSFDAGTGSLLGTFNAGVTASGSSFTATAPDWNTSLDAGEEISFGYVQEGSPTPAPSNVKLNGVACTVTGVAQQNADGSTPAPTTSAPVPTTSLPKPTTPEPVPTTTTTAPVPTTTPTPVPTTPPKPRGDMFSETFEDGYYDDWSGRGGAWKVMKGPWTIANVLQQTSPKATSQLVAGSAAWSNYMVEAHLRVAECGKAKSCSIGLAVRVKGNSSARLVLIPGYGGQLQIVKNGKATVVSSVPFEMKTKQWRIIRLEARGNTIVGIIDGTVIGTAKGAPTAGRVGIFEQNASASFDNIDVYRAI